MCPLQVQEGIRRELDFMQRLHVGDIVMRPPAQQHKVWGTRWCFRQKQDSVRCRFVVRQFRDSAGGDCFAATPRHEAIGLLLAIALREGHVLGTGDFSVAFMHTPLCEDDHIYVEPPPSSATARSGCGG